MNHPNPWPLNHHSRAGDRRQATARAVLFLPVLLLLVIGKPVQKASALAGDEQTAALEPRAPHAYEPKFFPFEKPEKVIYQASWIGIPVAEARIKATPVWEDGKKFYATQVKAKTLPYLDLIFRVRDTIQSVIDADTLKPHRFVYQQRKNDDVSNTVAHYEPGSGKWIIDVRQKKRIRRHELNFTDTLDPISASYLVRSLDFRVGDQLEFMVFVGGKRRYPLTLKVLRQEMIAIGGRVFEAYKITSRVELPGDKNKPPEFREAQVWLSSDEQRILLRATSQVLLGDFTIEMVRLESGKPVRIQNLRL